MKPDPALLTFTKPVLTLCNLPVLDVIIRGHDHIESELGLGVSSGWPHFGLEAFKHTRQKLLSGESPEWWTYLIIDHERRFLLGSCGFKGSPDLQGMVEIGYEVAAEYRNHGVATNVTAQLVEKAFESSEVHFVQAHTQAKENASVRVLRKNGFSFYREIEIDGKGMIWRWKNYRLA